MTEDISVRIVKLETQLDERAKALELQHAEYERRLAELNHAHEQAREKERDFVQLDKFEVFADQVNGRLRPLEVFRQRSAGFQALIALVAGAIGAVITKALS